MERARGESQAHPDIKPVERGSASAITLGIDYDCLHLYVGVGGAWFLWQLLWQSLLTLGYLSKCPYGSKRLSHQLPALTFDRLLPAEPAEHASAPTPKEGNR